MLLAHLLAYTFLSESIWAQFSSLEWTETTEEEAHDIAILPREKWQVDWYKSSALFAPIRRVTFNVASGERRMSPTDKENDLLSPREWRLGYNYSDQIRGGRLVGVPAILGDAGEGSRYAVRSAEGMEGLLAEQQFPEIFCRGAKHRRWFFGSQLTKQQLTLANQRCVESCFALSGEETQYNFSRYEISHSQSLRDCRVPLTHLVRIPLVKAVATDGPRATIELPRAVWTQAGVSKRTDMLDMLIHVKFAPCPPTHLQDTEEEDLTASPDGANNPLTTPLPSLPKTLPRNPVKRSPWQIDPWNLTAFDFLRNDTHQGPLVLAAPAAHYGSLSVSSMNGATVTGYFQEQAPVLGLEDTSGEAVIDVGATTRRLFEADRLEVALQSNCGIMHISPEAVFHKAMAWTHHISEQAKHCTGETTCRSCVAAGCGWCKRLSRAKDYVDTQWAKLSGIYKWGRCGAPEDVCIYDEGKFVAPLSGAC